MTTFLNKAQQILEIDTPLSSFEPTTKLVELGADSVKLVGVGSLIEETSNRPVYKDQLQNLTVGFLLHISQQNQQ